MCRGISETNKLVRATRFIGIMKMSEYSNNVLD